MKLSELITELESLPLAAEQAKILQGMLMTREGCLRLVEMALQDIIDSTPIEAYPATLRMREELKRLKELQNTSKEE